MRSTKYTRDVLAPVVAKARSLSEVIRALGLKPSGGNYRYIAAMIRRSGVAADHLRRWSARSRIEATTPAELAQLVESAKSLAQILIALGLPSEGRPHHELTARLAELNISTAHLVGRAWSRGETNATSPAVARGARKRTLLDGEVFIANGPMIGGPGLAKRLIRLGWRYACSWCGIETWRERSLVLHVDHVNGINNDNRLANLRLLCPNCHSQTPTYSNRTREVVV